MRLSPGVGTTSNFIGSGARKPFGQAKFLKLTAQRNRRRTSCEIRALRSAKTLGPVSDPTGGAEWRALFGL